MKKREFFTAKNLAFISLCSAILCILSPLSIQVGVIPISLATFAIYIISGILDYKKSLIAVCIYILLGIVGIPVFSNFTSGISVILGVTGGYIIGYIPCVFIESFIINKFENNKLMYLLAIFLGTAIIYIFGIIWFIILTKNSLIYTLKVCVFPFILTDLIKITVAFTVLIFIKQPISKIISK